MINMETVNNFANKDPNPKYNNCYLPRVIMMFNNSLSTCICILFMSIPIFFIVLLAYFLEFLQVFNDTIKAGVTFKIDRGKDSLKGKLWFTTLDAIRDGCQLPTEISSELENTFCLVDQWTAIFHLTRICSWSGVEIANFKLNSSDLSK